MAQNDTKSKNHPAWKRIKINCIFTLLYSIICKSRTLSTACLSLLKIDQNHSNLLLWQSSDLKRVDLCTAGGLKKSGFQGGTHEIFLYSTESSKDLFQACETTSYIFKLSHHRSAHNQCLLILNRGATWLLLCASYRWKRFLTGSFNQGTASSMWTRNLI